MDMFDEIVDRRGSGSYKWDSAGSDSGVLPLWVADMDFRTAPVVVEALRRRVEHGVFGYTLVTDDYYEALTRWFATRHGYSIDPARVIYTSGVVPAISAIIKALAEPGEGVIVQTPVYNCFFSSIRNNGCRVVENPLRRVDIDRAEFTYEMDFDGLERLAADPSNTLMLLCNPHNPAGRAWRMDELRRVAEICGRNGVRVVSDEIHCELTRPGTAYTPYANAEAALAPEMRGCPGVVCLSPSKAFNTAGLQIANIVCGDEPTRARVDKAININEVCDVNPFGVEALKAAYTRRGAAWLDKLRAYLFANADFASGLLRKELPQCPMARLEATYLLWVDVSALGIPPEEMEERMKEEAKVWVNAGDMYGTGGYIRINLACPRQLLADGLRRLVGWIHAQAQKNS